MPSVATGCWKIPEGNVIQEKNLTFFNNNYVRTSSKLINKYMYTEPCAAGRKPANVRCMPSFFIPRS